MAIAAALLLAALASAVLFGAFGQSAARADASAKLQAQSAISQIESCYATRHDYRDCALPALLSSAGVNVGHGAGQVSAQALGPTAYTVVATSSLPGPAGKGHATFTASKDLSGIVRSCNRPGVGACPPGGSW